MTLATALSAIRSLQDLHGLTQALGLAPLWDQLPAGAWRQPAPSAGVVVPIFAVARTGEFVWFGIESSQPARSARAYARRLAAQGRVGGVLTLDAPARRLGVAVAFDTVPVLEVDLTAPDRAALASLGRLTGVPAVGSLAYAARAADALSAERVGLRFFREFRATLAAMADALPGPMRAQDRHDFALLQLTRVLFLYFIQTKGWLAGRERFLAEAVDRCLGAKRRIHRDLLRPLFFGTLNRPAAQRTGAARSFGAVPFLNGGLFEPHPLEQQYHRDIPNALWRDAFDRLFERFHFTITERNDPGAVAPDMLGRVFEGVMDPDIRRSTGTFYTPAALVDRIVDAGLVAYLARRLGCSDRDAEQRLQKPDADALAVLETITILDPAVGSGAFLLGALERLATLGGPPTAARKRRILQRNLFGVDRNPTAVRLTELRLWLAVIADDTTERAEDIAPLPNLDCLIRQGDSLFDPVTPRSAEPADSLGSRVTALRALRERTIIAVGAAKADATRRLRAAELELLTASLNETESGLRLEIARCLRDAREHDLFGHRRGIDRVLAEALHRFREALREIRRARRQAHEGGVPWFHYRGHFADVFAAGGFDVLVGNPPWQRAESIPLAARQRLCGRYRWWRGRGTVYGHRPDLAIAFLERAFELAKPGGIVAMLVPAKLASASYGATARHAMASESTLHVVATLSDDPTAAFDATVYPLAVVAAKAPPPAEHRVHTTLDRSGTVVQQAALTGGGPWLLLPDRSRRALDALRAEHPRIEERFPCQLGVKTGANAVFLHPPPDLEPDVLRWAIRGRDVGAFRAVPSVRLLWTHNRDGQPYRALPRRAARYLAPHLSVLKARADFAGGPPWTLFRVGAATAPYRVIWADLCRQLTAAAMVGGADRACVPLNTCYVAAAGSAVEAERLAAWLNSTWIRIAAYAVAVPASGHFARFNAAVVGGLPLPITALQDAALSALAHAGAAGTNVQARLDAIAADHLGLSGRAQASLRSLLHAQPNDRR